MKLKIKRIVLAIRDVDRIPAATLRKAGRLARGLGASVELFHAVTDTAMFAGPLAWGASGDSAEKMAEAILAGARLQLALAAKSRDLADLNVTINAVWDAPAHEAIIRRALQTKADLVIVQMPSARGLKRLSFTNTDFELVRHCPVPLLMVNASGDYARPQNAVLASIDPLHERDKPAQLDNQIVSTAALFAAALPGKLHLFHAHLPLAARVPASALEPLSDWVSADAEDEYMASIRRGFNRVAKAAKIPAARCHLSEGRVAKELTTVCNAEKVAIAVLGAVSRSGLDRIFLGSTAESVFNHPPCDLLIVKPRGYRTDIPAKKPRAVTLIGAPVF